jgi:protein O-GlcNAc transferase
VGKEMFQRARHVRVARFYAEAARGSMEYLQFFFDWIWAFIFWLSGWQPGAALKNVIQWISVLAVTPVALYNLWRWVRGDRAATKGDIESLKADFRADLRAELARHGAAGQIEAGSAELDEGLARDLDKAVETLLAAGRADALKDKTGEAAEVALDELIAQRQAARQRVSQDEADLYRQKGALAFLHDTGKAMGAYAKATELDTDDPEAWNQLGKLQLRIGDLDVAIKSFERVLALGNSAADQATVAAATGNIGVIYRIRGELGRAEAIHRTSLALYEKFGGKAGMANQYSNLGVICRTRGDLDQAKDMHRKSLALNETLGRKEGMAANYSNLGLIYRARGHFDQAEDMHRKSLIIEEQLGRKEGVANQYGNLGIIAQARGNLDQAEEMYHKVLAIDERLARKASMAHAYGNLGVIYQQRGDLGKAEVMHRKCLIFNEQLGHKQGIAIEYGNLGLIYRTRGELDQAEAMFRKSLVLHQQLERKEGMAVQYGNLGVIYEQRGDLVQACAHWRKARDLYAQVGIPARVEKYEALLRDANCPAD